MPNPSVPGSGVVIAGWRASPEVAARIEWLGKMNEKRVECVENRDIEGLRRVASEYAARNMIRTANNIYKEIAIMESNPQAVCANR